MNQRSPRRTLLWFRRQLRLHDQPLFDAIDPAIDEVAGVFILDPREHQAEVDGRPRTGPHRMRFLLESVADLRASLARRGVDLLVRVGEPESILPGLARELSIDRLCLVEEPGTEERTVERAVQAAMGPEVVALPVETLLELDDPRTFARDLPEVFSKFRRHAEKRLQVAPPRPGPASLNGLERPDDVALGELPTLAACSIEEPAPDPRGVMVFQGGESAALHRLDAWIFGGDHLRRYKETRNGLLGESYSSKFSPWLATGCLSARFVAAETLRYEAERVANDSTYWLRFELLWRE
ncbi:MAG: deoxyribodipyrimidine photo-lyase, partial [Planctomycetota bacterium]|nr:deoxyribodipyrimidine photo-lyase [Planctomycetota bacterium]